MASVKFMILGKSKYVHVVRTKREDLRAGEKGSGCQQVRKHQVAGNVPKGNGLSREAASALDPCPNCGTAAVLKSMMTPEEKREAAKAKRDETLDKMKPAKKKGKGLKGKDHPKSVRKSGGGSARLRGDSTREKAEALLTFAEEHGWKASVYDADPGLVLEALRGDEIIKCWFVDGKYDSVRHARLIVGGWEGKLRGVHGCRKQMAGEGRDRPHANPGKGRSISRKSKDAEDEVPEDESPEDARRRVPFLLDDDDIVILDAILGKTIRWRNGISNAVEEAWLPAKAEGKKRPKVTITTHPKSGRRMVDFLTVVSVTEDGEQYGPERTVYLDKIVRVS